VRIVKSDLPRAMDVLEGAGVPRIASPSMADVFKKDGFISSPLEERARFIAATKMELEQTIARMTGVIDARVHLAMPARDPLTDVVVPPSASVLVKVAPDVKFSENGGIANVKALVRDAVESLSVDRITVVATPAAGSWRHAVRPSDTLLAGYAYQKPLVTAEAWAAIATLLVAGLAAVLWRYRASGLWRWRRTRGAAAVPMPTRNAGS
jgi:type III secretion protein J